MLWSAIEALSLALVSFAMLAMLARYLDASTFGKAAIALGIVQIACSLAESFFHDAVVQRGDLREGDVDAAHTSSVLIALVLAAGIAINAVLAGPHGLGQDAEIARLALWMSPSRLRRIDAIDIAHQPPPAAASPPGFSGCCCCRAASACGRWWCSRTSRCCCCSCCCAPCAHRRRGSRKISPARAGSPRSLP